MNELEGRSAPDAYGVDTGRQVVVCGATDEHGHGYLCILPPTHVQHTTSPAGVVWHKHVTVEALSLEFATTPPGYQRPKLADLAGIFAGSPVVPESAEPKRYFVGYYCPHGTGHWEMVGSGDYEPWCRSKGWEVYLEGAQRDDEGLPPGEWE